MEDTPGDLKFFAKHFEKTVWRDQWARAAAHHNGAGMENGVWVEQLRKHIRALRAKSDYKTAACLTKAAAAGFWPKTRSRKEGYMMATVACPLCGECDDTDLHRIWQCRFVCCTALPEIQESANLINQAVFGAESEPCFWLRGLVPLNALPVIPELPVQDVLLIGKEPGAFANETWDVSGRVLYLDESGGPEASTPLLRRPAWGIAWLKAFDGLTGEECEEDPGFFEKLCEFEGGFCAGVADAQNTATRAALRALLFILLRTSGNATVAPDCIYVTGGFGKFRDDSQGCHADLWHQIDLAKRQRRGKIEMLKVKAHRTEQDVVKTGSGVELQHFAGNHYADRLAARAALEARVPEEIRDEVFALERKAVAVQRRIAAANMLIVDALEGKPPEEGRASRAPKRNAKRELLERSGHWLIPGVVGNQPALRCRRCRQGGSKKAMWQWLKNEGHTCRGVRKADHISKNEIVRPGRGANAVRIGGRPIHPTHALASASGVWFCSSCGVYATAAEGKKSGGKLLFQPCRKEATRGGKCQLRRIEAGRPPRASMEMAQVPQIQQAPSVRLAQLAAMHADIAMRMPKVLEQIAAKRAGIAKRTCPENFQQPVQKRLFKASAPKRRGEAALEQSQAAPAKRRRLRGKQSLTSDVR